MKNGAWRLDRLLYSTLVNILIALPQAAAADTDTAADFVHYYQRAYAQGRDLIPGPILPLDTSSIATRLDLQTIRPQSALTGTGFVALDGTIVKLAGAQGCLSTEAVEFSGLRTTCATVSLAGMTATLNEAEVSAGNAFPCHVFAKAPGTPTVYYAECFFVEDGGVRSLSETLISRGLAFAARDGAGVPVFPEYAKAEEQARRAKAGIWANAYFVHPYGARYRADLATN